MLQLANNMFGSRWITCIPSLKLQTKKQQSLYSVFLALNKEKLFAVKLNVLVEVCWQIKCHTLYMYGL